jgi:beta-glucuronidase
VDRNPYLAGAIYWTLREFAVKPHWDGGTLLPVAQRDSIHHKGLLRYDGTPKPAWYVARDRFTATPLYAPGS